MKPSQALQVKVAAAFTAVILGFVGTAAYLPRALWSYTSGAQQIQEQFGGVVAVLTELRGCGRDVRQAAMLAFHERAEPVRSAYEAEVALARERCASLVAAHSASVSAFPAATDPGRAAWQHFVAEDVPAHDAAVDAVVVESRRPRRDPRVLSRLLEVVTDGDAQLEAMVSLYAAAAETGARDIDAGLRRLSSVYLALAALGAAGAVILLVETVRVVRRHARIMDRQLAELDAFGGHVAHDLRGPLQTIRLAVGAIERRTEDPAVQRLARGAASGVGRLDAMIRDLLQFARGGAAHTEQASADVAAVIAHACEELAAKASEAQVKVTVDADRTLVARVAPVALEAIVSNLVDNAIKYRSSERANEVVVMATRQGHEAWIAVSDRGPGIRADLLPHLFEPFVRGSDRPDSTGLGLATVRRLVEAHHGKITIQSSGESGTTFLICLPAVARAARTASPAAPGALFFRKELLPCARASEEEPPQRRQPPARPPPGDQASWSI